MKFNYEYKLARSHQLLGNLIILETILCKHPIFKEKLPGIRQSKILLPTLGAYWRNFNLDWVVWLLMYGKDRKHTHCCISIIKTLSSTAMLNSHSGLVLLIINTMSEY